MKLFIFLLLSVLFSTISVYPQKTRERKEYSYGLSENKKDVFRYLRKHYFVLRKDKKKIHGPLIYYHSNGNKKLEMAFIEGDKHGIIKGYRWKDSSIFFSGLYENDLRQGTWKYFGNDGRLKIEGNYIDNKKSGKWTIHESDSVRIEYNYSDDLKNGPYLVYFNNKIIIEGNFLNGELDENINFYYTEKKYETDSIFGVVEKKPNFYWIEKDLGDFEKKYGSEALLKEFYSISYGSYLYSNIQITNEIRENRIADVCYIKFDIDKAGRVSNVTVMEGLHDEIDRQLVKLIEETKYWSPGLIDGNPVNMSVILPFKYSQAF
jgi:antitoxin component YwqK of YwqJK toxin-antitoxin module